MRLAVNSPSELVEGAFVGGTWVHFIDRCQLPKNPSGRSAIPLFAHSHNHLFAESRMHSVAEPRIQSYARSLMPRFTQSPNRSFGGSAWHLVADLRRRLFAASHVGRFTEWLILSKTDALRLLFTDLPIYPTKQLFIRRIDISPIRSFAHSPIR